MRLERLRGAGGALALAAVIASAGSVAGGCGSHDSSSSATSSDSACSDITVDRFKELLIVDPAVVSDTRASNAADGAWSFRHAIENMAPPGTDPGDFVRSWLLEWAGGTSLNGYPLDTPGEGRAAQMNTRILCPWEQATAANGCNSDCSVCTADPPKLDLSQAPLRLIAIVNRSDVRTQIGMPEYGEGRLLYAMMDGSADSPSSTPLPMTVALEYALPTTTTLKESASAWHALGALSDYGEDYKAALQQITDSFVSSGTGTGVNGSSINQVRTNESALDWIWQLREFELGTDGGLHAHTTMNTPDESLNSSSQLVDYINTNATAIIANKFSVPDGMLGGSADQFIFRWTFPGVDPVARNAFVLQTCNGCHSDGVAPSVDIAFHISPFRSGVDAVSPYLNNPASPDTDELANRTTSLRSALCSND